MMAIEKCDKVVINSLFGTGLQYKHRVSQTSASFSAIIAQWQILKRNGLYLGLGRTLQSTSYNFFFL